MIIKIDKSNCEDINSDLLDLHDAMVSDIEFVHNRLVINAKSYEKENVKIVFTETGSFMINYSESFISLCNEIIGWENIKTDRDFIIIKILFSNWSSLIINCAGVEFFKE